jgi:hypothetical protein
MSYLLRLWQTGDPEQPVWRASLQYSRTGEIVGFASIEDLFAYLQTEAGLDVSQATG